MWELITSATQRAPSSPIRRTVMNVSYGMLTFLLAFAGTGRLRRSRIHALPFFCLSSGFFSRLMPVLNLS